MKRLFWCSLIALCLNSCGHAPAKRELDLTECVYDPDHHAGECSSGTLETEKEVPETELRNWVMRAPETDKAYWDACYLQRKQNGK